MTTIMSNEVFSIDEIRMAYRKFKSYVYYDNFNLHLRYKLASFETQAGGIDEALRNLWMVLNHCINEKDYSSIKEWIEESGYCISPKSFKEQGGSFDLLISNKNNAKQIRVSKTTILYDGPIELFIISTLWTLNAHKYLPISYDSYGYTLPSNDSSTLLFEPYFNKYQEWRDRGISAAKEQIDRKNNVLFVTLDIKNFFHSARLDFEQLQRVLPLENNKLLCLTTILSLIYRDHTDKIYENISDCILPIGLPSSGVIANWLLSDFDKDIKNAMAPIYYGRYVDDIFIVISNVEEPDGYNVAQWLCDRFFSKGNVLKIDNNQEGDASLKLISQRCNNLEIQQDKLKLFYFDSHWSLALLNKFQATIQENSSAFWFLPNDEDLKDSLDDTYDLHYKDTINKFRSIESCKVNKYGASVFLAKRLKLAILSPGNHDTDLEYEIFRFFNGESIISMYSMWEKVFTYFAITKNYNAILRLQDKINDAILKISFDSTYQYRDSLNIENGVNQYLEGHLEKCLMMAQTYVVKDIVSSNNKVFIRHGSKIIKKSLLTRHYLLPLPILAFTSQYIDNDIDIVDFHISDITEGIADDVINQYWRIPRHVSMHEICCLYLPIILAERYESSFYQDNENKYFEKCLFVYKQLNQESLDNIVCLDKYKNYSESNNKEHKLKIKSEVITINTPELFSTLIVGVSNVNTSEDDVHKAITDKSTTSSDKRKRHIDILNQAEKLKVDILLLPEVFVPLNWLCAYADESKRKQRAMVFGVEHFTIHQCCYNIAVSILPFEFHGRREAFIVPRLKNHYSPNEEMTILGYRKQIPRKDYSIYHLCQWRGVQFTVYNCYELTDIVHRCIFRSDLDVLFAVEYNKDVNYFSNISESVSRDLHCYYVQANTSYYGDSRVVEPRETLYQNPVRVKGGENDVIIKHVLKIDQLRQFQEQTHLLQCKNKERGDKNNFKMTPPDYQHDKVCKRGRIKNA